MRRRWPGKDFKRITSPIWIVELQCYGFVSEELPGLNGATGGNVMGCAPQSRALRGGVGSRAQARAAKSPVEERPMSFLAYRLPIFNLSAMQIDFLIGVTQQL